MQKIKSYGGLSPWAWAINLALMLLIAVLAIVQTGKGRELPFHEFREHAREIGLALEAFARDHEGRYPNDGVDNNSPPGLSSKYIQWQKEWNVDYEVHDNGHGGRYVALEYLGRYKKDTEFHAIGLTRDPNYRKLYGQGQPIPRRLNRIWVFHEEAPIYYP
jgi:hypothetical protein